MSVRADNEHQWRFLCLLGSQGRRRLLRAWRARPPSLRSRAEVDEHQALTSPSAVAWLEQKLPASNGREALPWQRLRDEVLNARYRVLLPSDLPLALRAIPDPPLALYVQGSDALTSPANVAIVGARRCSATGRSFALRLGERLAAAGCLVVSGLAFGIDGAAHQGALQQGRTLAVLGSGLGNLYPRSHAALARSIIEKSGCIVSEYLPTYPSYPANFPERNRIISGLAQAVVVVEAGLRSGSLITARLALEQGREVLAVPGSVLSPVSAGCHRLLKQGAGLVTEVEDVFAALGLEPQRSVDGLARDQEPPASLEAKVFAKLGGEPTSVEALSQSLGLGVPELLTLLTRLELAGFVQRLPQGYIPSPR